MTASKYRAPRKKDPWKNDASPFLWIAFLVVLALGAIAIYTAFK